MLYFLKEAVSCVRTCCTYFSLAAGWQLNVCDASEISGHLHLETQLLLERTTNILKFPSFSSF
jgi:hypothetical protein